MVASVRAKNVEQGRRKGRDKATMPRLALFILPRFDVVRVNCASRPSVSDDFLQLPAGKAKVGPDCVPATL